MEGYSTVKQYLAHLEETTRGKGQDMAKDRFEKRIVDAKHDNQELPIHVRSADYLLGDFDFSPANSDCLRIRKDHNSFHPKAAISGLCNRITNAVAGAVPGHLQSVPTDFNPADFDEIGLTTEDFETELLEALTEYAPEIGDVITHFKVGYKSISVVLGKKEEE
jgi:hypothetical protein